MELTFSNVNKYFGDFHVLQNVSFTIHSGEIFGYLGRNGAGKTTSIRVLMDVFKATSGDVLIDGQPFNPHKHRIGYLPEERGMYAKSTVKDQLIYFAQLRGASRKEAEVSVKYWAKKFEVEEYLTKTLETLSKGNQQKVQITQAFLNEPDILILDEPFSGLDPVNSKVFQDALIEYVDSNRFVIFSSHQMGYVETFCDRIAIINKGAIVLEGNLKDIKKSLGVNKVRVAVNNMTSDALVTYFNEKGINAVYERPSVVVTLEEGKTKQDLMRVLLDDALDVHVFGDYEPSLQDIFVSKVGGNHETV